MEMFGPCSEMPAELMQSLPVASLQPDINQDGGGSLSDICGIQIRIFGKGHVENIKLICFQLCQMSKLYFISRVFHRMEEYSSS